MMRLVKFLAKAGVCSRRKAAELVRQGVVAVNGSITTEPWYRVGPEDRVEVHGRPVFHERLRYILLNKPKDAVTTLKDPQGRRTVVDILGNQIPERIVPVGRLDRDTTGILLLTNDGDLAYRLLHPKFEIRKEYIATLDYPLLESDRRRLLNGEIVLVDGPISFDSAEILGDGRVRVVLHSGRNRIIRRTFAKLGYKVLELDRTKFAGLSYGNLPRSSWRELTEGELDFLKNLTQER